MPPTRLQTTRAVQTVTARLDNATNTLYRNHLNFMKDLVPEMGRAFRLVYSVRVLMAARPGTRRRGAR